MATSAGGSSNAGAPRLVIDDLLAEYADVQQALSDPAVHADQAASRRLGRRYAELTPILTISTELAATRGDLEAARELGAEDASFAQEAVVLQAKVEDIESKLAELLAPRDPDDAKDVLIEVKAGEGGEESALFAGDLMRMYLRYAERRGWKTPSPSRRRDPRRPRTGSGRG